MDRLARKRIQSCGLQDKVTLICTEISRSRYMSQLTDYLRFYDAEFDTVISMLPSGDGLIQFNATSSKVRECEAVLHSWV